MRILLYPKFIADEVSKPLVLQNCNLVIDGNNIFYNVYRDNKLPYIFGLEANEHATRVWRILTMLKKANVNCYIVFKGGDTDVSKKKQKIKDFDFDIDSNCSYVAPMLMLDVCKQVLDEAGVKYSTCLAESKDDCCALAQLLGCPVLSNDIEYCFRPAHYIPYRTFEIYSHTKNYIACKQYSLKKFLIENSLTEKKYCMFAALSDIQIFPQNYFEQLFQKWHVHVDNLYTKNQLLLQWLSEHDADVTLREVLQFISDDLDRKKFLNHVESMFKIMTNVKTKPTSGDIVTDYLYNDCKLTISRCDPLWFEKGVAMQNIAKLYINLYKHQYIEGSSAIEKKTSIDSIMLSIDIIKYAYNLLTNFQKTQISVYQNSTTYINVNTEDLSIKKPAYQCIESVFENGWENINRFKLFQHFLRENNININLINKLPEEARVLFIAMVYAARKKTVALTKETYSFIISYVMIHVVFEKESSRRKQRSGINEVDSAAAKAATKKYFKCEEYEAKQIYDGDVLKTLVEMQYCLSHMNNLNSLCGAPYKPTKYHRTINATFIYKVLRDMEDSDENEYIESLFQTAPSVLNFVKLLTATYKELI